MTRLRRMGAPVPKREFEDYGRRDKFVSGADILDEIRDAAAAPEYLSEPVNELVQVICHDYGITTIYGIAERAPAKGFVKKARLAALRARKEALRMERVKSTFCNCEVANCT